MMQKNANVQNFWPGYLDALINVMLNLLFLVAIFGMGLVSINLQSLAQKTQLSRLNEQVTHVVAQMDLTPGERSTILGKLANMDIAAMLGHREELDRRQQLMNVTASADTRAAAFPPQTSATRASPADGETPPQDLRALKAANQERQRELEDLDSKIKDITSQVVQEKARSLASQPSRPQPQPEPMTDIRTTARAQSPERMASSVKADELRNSWLATTGLKPQAVWEFAPNEFNWGPAQALPDGVSTADPSGTWLLLGFVDATNGRVRREVFARIQAVRKKLIDSGFVQERIRLELRPTTDAQSGEEQAHRWIFMLAQP
jgi:hypothetical protein